MKRLSTIGYEGRTQEEVLDALDTAGVALLIDVRAIASSRRPGFSKSALAAALRERGIDYVHFRALGTPKAGREAVRAGHTAEMHAIYEKQLATPEAQLAFEQAVAAAGERHAALLCYENDAAGCHRTLLARHMSERTPFVVSDL